ncbi:CHAT domain-containing protein [Mesorhizobium sp. RIZ17]|uniref:CHAT domain-containing protein n=1 Tax=Mesorhizobium sp. RIZ17 TaxID=3132743 RepID=UPI003DA87C25
MIEQVVSSQTASHLPEKLEFFAKALRGDDAYSMFLTVSKGHKKPKFVSELAAQMKISSVRVSQVAARLANLGIISKGRGKNPNTGRTENYYEKRHDIDVLKGKIIRLRNNPSALSTLVTMRRPSTSASKIVSFIKAKPVVPVKGTRGRLKVKVAALRVAFLGTNPESSRPLRTDIEARNLARALKATTNRDSIEIRYVPAAEWADLLATMNEFKPHIVHFSGHGGDQGVLFDNESVYDDGGIEIDYKLLNSFIGATGSKPDLLVLNACDTVKGARIFLKTVKAVVAMSSNIDDLAATYFSRFMYVALAEGQSLSKSVAQGKLALAAMRLPDASLPTLIHSADIDPDTISYF